MKTNVLILLAIALSTFANAQPSPTKGKNHDLETAGTSIYFQHHFIPGEKLNTIFSRAIAVRSDDFATVVNRVSGTGEYTVVSSDPSRLIFSTVFLYDGRPEANGKSEIKDSGKTLIYNGQSFTNTDASGLTYNPLQWGTPPAKLKQGDTWAVDITQPWELGGPGHQVVTVIDADPFNHIIRLKREGSSEGFFADDRKEMNIVKDNKTIKMQVTPGSSHWTGYTIFKDGIIMSDELLVTRPLILTADSLKFSATQREYILLNQMP